MTEAIVTPAYCKAMAAYNSEMNRRLYSAAKELSETDRRSDRGAFWRSIHGTLNHILWGDQMWMSRFAGWQVPTIGMRQSPNFFDDFTKLEESRAEADAGIERWARSVTPEWLAGDLSWFSGAAQREISAPKSLLVAHFFNHQTHHRGQVHAMLTAAGRVTGDTDLFILVPTIPS